MKTANERASGAPKEPSHGERHHGGHGEVAAVGTSRAGNFGGVRWCERFGWERKDDTKLRT